MELDKAIMEIGEGLHKLFPKMHLLESNHGSMVTRKMKHHGIPVRVLKPLEQLYETPLWSWHNEILLETTFGPIFMHHGLSPNGLKVVKDHGMSIIQGHFHTVAGVQWFQTRFRHCFAAYFSCLVDRDSYAMAYAKNNIPLYQLGAGYLDKRGLPFYVPMRLDKGGRWIGRL